MDALPIALTAVCERVDRIEVQRVQDARVRRLPFQQKIGAGLTPEQFQRGVDNGTLRHVGFTESIQMIADAIGWKLERVTDEIKPKIADTPVESELLAVDPGYVCGIVQDGVGYVKGEPRITLHLEAYLGAPESFDSVLIEGSPRIHSKIDGGVHGDIATASMAVNSIPAVIAARARLPHDARHAAAVVQCVDDRSERFSPPAEPAPLAAVVLNAAHAQRRAHLVRTAGRAVDEVEQRRLGRGGCG